MVFLIILGILILMKITLFDIDLPTKIEESMEKNKDKSLIVQYIEGGDGTYEVLNPNERRVLAQMELRCLDDGRKELEVKTFKEFINPKSKISFYTSEYCNVELLYSYTTLKVEMID